MQIGISFPQTEIGADPAVIRDFAQAAEDLGYARISVVDHVVQQGTPKGPEFARFYSREAMFHECLTTLAFMAASTRTIGLASAILILPQRQAVLVAKQAAQVDVFSGGRLRLGVGLGWNEVEFDALGMGFHDRGKRVAEQIEVMRRLWSEDLVTFEGHWHRFADAGLNPEPVQRPIPVWLGALADPAIRRAARIADGWYMYPRQEPDAAAQARISLFRQAAAEAGREPDSLGINATVFASQGAGPDEWLAVMSRWRELGVDSLTFRTAESDLACPDGHIAAMRGLMDAAKGA